ncbi:uncharacterized protein [Primulina huaijiensis]|uniref:uncharacterized protein n=1 Tax=Primulina huaijiensis TaxID=1492673 RepID=UPI003CC71472
MKTLRFNDWISSLVCRNLLLVIFNKARRCPSMAISARVCHVPNGRVFSPLRRKYPDFTRKSQPIYSSSQFSSLQLHPRIPSIFRPLAFNRSPLRSPSKFQAGQFTDKQFASVYWGPKEDVFHWNYVCVGEGNNGVTVVDEKDPEVAVVLLGWLGAKTKHLKRYVSLYNARGVHAITFVASVTDVLGFDLGRRIQERVERLSDELVSWLSRNDGRKRFLIFHTFSNTGWLAYGEILKNLKDRKGIPEKIKGCVVDSGGDPNIDPKVWAAGFSTALLKRSISSTSPSTGEETEPTIGIKGTNIEEGKPFFLETLLLSAFVKIFSFLLNLPSVHRRLTEVVSILSHDQPPLQLYLYSTEDKVIPFETVQSFMEGQRRSGRKVFSFNFGSSPHVDHYRTFPELYTLQLDYFLEECRLILVDKSQKPSKL